MAIILGHASMKTFLKLITCGIALGFVFVFCLVVASWVWVLFGELAQVMVQWSDELVRQLTAGIPK